METEPALPDLESALLALTIEYSQIGADDRRSLNMLPAGFEILKNASVKAQVVIGHATFRLADLMGLRSGQVLALDSSLDVLVEVMLDGKPIANGQLMAVGAHFAVRVIAADRGIQV